MRKDHLQEFFVDYPTWWEAVTQERASERESIEQAIAAEQEQLSLARRQADKLKERYTSLVATDDPEAVICAEAWEDERTRLPRRNTG